MKKETPAKGMLKINDWGHSKMYKIVCECGNNECSHTLDIEAENEITVTIYTHTKTNFWSKTRWAYLWQLLIKGRVEFETALVLDQQTALNYAEALKAAVQDVENFKKS